MRKLFISMLFILLFSFVSSAQEVLPGVDIKSQPSTKKTGETSKLVRLELEINHLNSNLSRIKIFAGHGKDRPDLPIDGNLGTYAFEVYKDQVVFDGSFAELLSNVIKLDSAEKASEFKTNFLEILADTSKSKGLIFEFNKLVNLLITKNALIIQKD